MDNIRSNLEQEFARKEQELVQRLQHDLRAKIESKSTAIHTQYEAEFNTEINKLQNKWMQERLKINADHNVQITVVLKEVEMLKQQSLLAKQSVDNDPGAKVAGLQEKFFNVIPGTVNTCHGGAVEVHDETIQWSKANGAPPVPPQKHVHFTSTPLKPVEGNLFDSDDDQTIWGHQHQQHQPTLETDATTIIGNTFATVASEFKKMHEPKIQKLKGGTTSSASLFFT